MKTRHILEKKFTDRNRVKEFLDYLWDGALMQGGSDLKIEIRQKDNSLKITHDETVAPMVAQLVADFEDAPKPALRLFCDGGSRGNPGPGACGFVILDAADKQLVSGGKFFDYCTNNYAEYMSLKEGVKAALRKRIEHLSIYMDSQLVVKQIKGEYKIKHKDLVPLHRDIKSDLASLKSYEITYIPRSHNKLADSLVNQILDQNS